MADDRPSTGKLGAILGAAAFFILLNGPVIFVLSGGEYSGKKTVNSDADLPPVATAK